MNLLSFPIGLNSGGSIRVIADNLELYFHSSYPSKNMESSPDSSEEITLGSNLQVDFSLLHVMKTQFDFIEYSSLASSHSMLAGFHS